MVVTTGCTHTELLMYRDPVQCCCRCRGSPIAGFQSRPMHIPPRAMFPFGHVVGRVPLASAFLLGMSRYTNNLPARDAWPHSHATMARRRVCRRYCVHSAGLQGSAPVFVLVQGLNLDVGRSNHARSAFVPSFLQSWSNRPRITEAIEAAPVVHLDIGSVNVPCS
jgi:hypothetical protein